ncbi:MAG: helix-turn-helix transcriptional regulator [Culicoidibacterales bacterium]
MSRELKALRARYNLNQSKVAEVIGTTVPTYSLKETGNREFTKSEIDKIVAMFKQYDESLTYEKIFK